jgi:hypothetical protein
VWNRHELGECRPSQEGIVRSLKTENLKLYGFNSDVLPCPEGYMKRDLTDGCHCYTGDYTMERSPTGPHKRSRQPHLVKGFQKKEVEGAATIHEHLVEINVLYDWVDYQGIPPRLWYKVRVVTATEGNADLGPSTVLRGGAFGLHDLLGLEATKNVIDLFISLREVALGILGLFLLIGRLARHENLICKTLESVVVSVIVLSLGVKNANVIQEAFKFARTGLVLLMMMRPL